MSEMIMFLKISFDAKSANVACPSFCFSLMTSWMPLFVRKTAAV